MCTVPRLEECPLPLANSLAQSWHMEKSCDHWASQDFPGFVAPQLLQQTHFVQTWKEKNDDKLRQVC